MGNVWRLGQGRYLGIVAGQEQPGEVAELTAEQQLVLDVAEANLLNFRQGGQFYDLDVAHDDLQIMENTTPWGEMVPPGWVCDEEWRIV